MDIPRDIQWTVDQQLEGVKEDQIVPVVADTLLVSQVVYGPPLMDFSAYVAQYAVPPPQTLGPVIQVSHVLALS